MYAILDVQTSLNIGVKGADRKSVHISLFIILFILVVHYYVSLKKRYFTISIIEMHLWLITIWICISNLINSVDLWSAIKQIGISVLWVAIYSFFKYYGKNYFETHNQISKGITIMFIFYILATFYAIINIQKIYGRLAVANLSYYVLVFLPWMIILYKGKKKNIIILIITFVIFISLKRGAIVALIAMLIAYLFIEGKVRNRYMTTMVKTIGILILFFVVFIFVNNTTNNYLINRFSYESLAIGSGRNIIYSSIIKSIGQRNIIEMIFGLGSLSTLKYIGKAAHNDWLEFLFSFGIIGLFIYLSMFLSIFKRALCFVKSNYIYSSSFCLIVIYIVLISLYGMFYFAHSTLYIMALIGFLDGLFFTYSQKNVVVK
jgi:hypothetical protein